MIGALLDILIYVIILGVLWYAMEYIINHVPVPDPPARFVRILVVVIFCIIIISLLLSLAGVGGISMPRIVG